MSTRKYVSRYEKLKKRKKEEKLIESQKGSIDKFVISNKQNITQNLDENITNEQEILQKLKLLDNDSLQKYCLKLESFLKHYVYYDIDGLDLFSELKVLKEILQIKYYTPIDILNYIKILDSFPNTCIAYKILLTIPVTVASAKRSFLKLKLIKSYIRLTMSQERLNGLVILSIKKEMLEELEYKNLIGQFASQNVRKIDFNNFKYMKLFLVFYLTSQN